MNPAADGRDEVVAYGEDALLVIGGGTAEMFDDVRWESFAFSPSANVVAS